MQTSARVAKYGVDFFDILDSPRFFFLITKETSRFCKTLAKSWLYFANFTPDYCVLAKQMPNCKTKI